MERRTPKKEAAFWLAEERAEKAFARPLGRTYGVPGAVQPLVVVLAAHGVHWTSEDYNVRGVASNSPVALMGCHGHTRVGYLIRDLAGRLQPGLGTYFGRQSSFSMSIEDAFGDVGQCFNRGTDDAREAVRGAALVLRFLDDRERMEAGL